jgi:hypothetical protein
VSVTVAPLRSTLRLRACEGCAATFDVEEPACPRCEAPAHHDDVLETVVDESRRRSWWLELHVDMVERALSLMRLDDAQLGLQRIEDAITTRRDDIDTTSFDRAFDVAIRVSAARGDAAWIRWVLDTQSSTGRVPSRAVVDRLRALPPILLEDAHASLQRLTESITEIADDEESERLDVLRGLCFELEKFRAVSA